MLCILSHLLCKKIDTNPKDSIRSLRSESFGFVVKFFVESQYRNSIDSQSESIYLLLKIKILNIIKDKNTKKQYEIKKIRKQII